MLVLFGDCAISGFFGKVRGCGVKGPVLEIKKRLSEQMPVIECSEFRTSKLCLDCGRVAKFYNYGVSLAKPLSYGESRCGCGTKDWSALPGNKEEGLGFGALVSRLGLGALESRRVSSGG